MLQKSINVKKPTKEGFEALKRCMYEFTGNDVYFCDSYYYDFKDNGDCYINLIECFWYLRNRIQKFVRGGRLPEYHMYNLNRTELPFIYNSLVF